MNVTYVKRLFNQTPIFVSIFCVYIVISFLICRWILLCFKREFPEADALRMWESCWAHYQTDYFHLFLCVAIIAVYGDDIIEQSLPADEVLLHFSSLAMHMNGDVVLRKVSSDLSHHHFVVWLVFVFLAFWLQNLEWYHSCFTALLSLWPVCIFSLTISVF